jgi:small subunit ribosomal protein S4e
MARGPKKHLKRLFAPPSWMLSKLKGVYAPRPRAGPHKLRECIPLVVLLRNRLKLALNSREATFILKNRNIKVDGRVRSDPKYPCGFMDIVAIPKTKDSFRILLDAKGRFSMVRVDEAEANTKLCKVVKRVTLSNRTPAVVTHDGRTIRFADPSIAAGDSIVLNTADSKIQDFVKFRAGSLAMITGGKNMGRVGTIVDVERHPGSFNIVHVRDASENTFATRESNVFVIGKESSLVTLPKDEGIRMNVAYERELRIEQCAKKTVKKASAKRRNK